MKIRHLPILAMVTMALQSCSSDGVNRAGYGVLQGAQQYQCDRHPADECPERESYDDYRERKEAYEKSRP